MMQERVVAIAADYADALLVARRAKRAILLMLVLVLLAQLAIFATAQFAPDLLRPSAATTQPSNWPDALHYVTALTLALGLVLSLLLVAVLFLTIHIMLVGRLIGVGYVTKAFTLSMLVVLLLFPWQTLLETRDLAKKDLVIPGSLYTWREVEHQVLDSRAARATAEWPVTVLYWARFVGFPLLTLMMLLIVQVRSGRGLKLALGEEELIPGDHHDVVVNR